MVGNRLIGIQIGSWAASALLLMTCLSAQTAVAADCPGHPDAIGTSRTLVVDPHEYPRIGTMQYPETLPLHDHEVVLTFDDGPLPRNSNKILQILADQCVKATFFLIGQQAQAYPDSVRKLAALGHTIGTHSQDHPLTFERMPIEKVKQEVDEGIASVSAALPDPTVLAPFFRVPGLLRAQDVEDYLASKGIQIWSADFPADDWRHISSQRVYELAIKRIEAKGKGILLLHDIHARTVAALPRILHELKLRGYHIVHVVPATPEQPATPTDPREWRLHPGSDADLMAEQLKLPTFVFTEAESLMTPAPSDFDAPNGELSLSGEPFDRVRRPIGGTSASGGTIWPHPTTVQPQKTAVMLPVPDESVFEIPEKTPTALVITGLTAHQPDRPAARGTPKTSGAINRGHNLRTHRAHDVRRTGRTAHSGPLPKDPSLPKTSG